MCNSSQASSLFSTPGPECKQMGKSESRRKLSREEMAFDEFAGRSVYVIVGKQKM